MSPEFTQMMAHYNQWMNQRMYQAASGLVADELKKDQGAFLVRCLASCNTSPWPTPSGCCALPPTPQVLHR